MKKIEAVLRPERLGHVKNALESIGISGMTILGVVGIGEQKDFKQQWRAYEYSQAGVPKVKLETFVKDEFVSAACSEIMKHAWTGNVGDGIIFVSPVERVIRIRTGEEGEDVL